MKNITLNELRGMAQKEGLILQGCGGDLNEWVTGINNLLTREGILRDGDTFKDVSAFEHDGHTNLLFNMDDVNLDIGKLAMWRLKYHDNFGGVWLSDYLSNRMGVDLDAPQPEKQKPDCPLIGQQDGNIFNLVGIASRTLKENELREEAGQMSRRVFDSGSYDEALGIIAEYVNITGGEDMDADEDYGMGGQS